MNIPTATKTRRVYDNGSTEKARPKAQNCNLLVRNGSTKVKEIPAQPRKETDSTTLDPIDSSVHTSTDVFKITQGSQNTELRPNREGTGGLPKTPERAEHDVTVPMVRNRETSQQQQPRRRSVRRIRRERSEQTLETFTEVSGEDCTLESCLYTESEDLYLEEEIEYGCSTNENESKQIQPMVQDESKQIQPMVQDESKQIPHIVQLDLPPNTRQAEDITRRRSRRHSIGNISISVNMHPGAIDGGKRSHRGLKNGNVTVQVNLGRSNHSTESCTIRTFQHHGSQTQVSNLPKPKVTLATKNRAHTDLSSDGSDNDSHPGRAIIASISIQLNQDETSHSETRSTDTTNESALETSVKKPGVSIVFPTARTKVVPEIAAQVTSTRPNKRDIDRTSLSDMNRQELIEMIRSNGTRYPIVSPEKPIKSNCGDVSSGSLATPTPLDPLSGSIHGQMVESTETTEAYESAVSMQNIGLHNRYGFMVDDKEVRRSSSRRRSTLSFNTSSSEAQGHAQCQMRNNSEPVSKTKTKPLAASAVKLSTKQAQTPATTLKYSSVTSRSKYQSTNGPELPVQSRYGQRPPMQKSYSTRSLAKRSLMYRHSSSRSITQSQTIEEEAQMQDGEPYAPTNCDMPSVPRHESTRSISKMTIMCNRRPSKSRLYDDDDNLSVSDMGSVMSFGRGDDESTDLASQGVSSVVSGMSGKSAVSKKSSVLSVFSKKSSGLRVGKLLKKISLRRKRSDDSVGTGNHSIRSGNFFTNILTRRGSKREPEPWRALDMNSSSYWADRVDDSHHNVKLFPASGENRRIQRRASM